MAKSKDRVMLEKLFNSAVENEIYEQLCTDGRQVLIDLAKHLGKPLTTLAEQCTISIRDIGYTDGFSIPNIINIDEVDQSLLEVEIFVYYDGKKVHTERNSLDNIGAYIDYE